MLGPSEDKEVERSPVKSEDNAEEEALSLKDNEGKKSEINFLSFITTSDTTD